MLLSFEGGNCIRRVEVSECWNEQLLAGVVDNDGAIVDFGSGVGVVE